MKLYNTLSRKKEEFKPISEGKVGIYSCGPTVYWNQHIGNMYAFLCWDILVRSLRYLGYEVKWVMNITDVGHMTSDEDNGEDKMEKGAEREGLTVWQIAKKYEKQFLESLEMLNIVKPDKLARATEHIKEQIELAQKIEKNGFAYKTKTGLVFDTDKFIDYAKFANLKLEEMEMGKRLEVDKDKKKPWDFLLWVTNQTNHQMLWDSPWGKGFPGWHLECTAMSTAYLGQKFDIHTGGIEHIGVHHTNEVAQGFGAFGENTANFWLHNAWLNLKKGKMSKSTGKVYTVGDLMKMGYDPLAFRYLVLQSHYKKGLVFSEESLEAAEKGWLGLRKLMKKWKEEGKKGRVNGVYRQKFIEKISDNLAMPEAIAVVWELTKSDLSDEDKRSTLLDFDKVLGLRLDEEKETKVPQEIEKMAKERWEAKKEKKWQEADRLRLKIEKEGWTVLDSQGSYKINRL